MNLKDKKTNFLIEIRKQEFNNYFSMSRRKANEDSENAFDVNLFEKEFHMLYSNKINEQFFLYKLKEIRQMSCAKSFYLRKEILSDDFCFFIDEVVQKYHNNDDILIELTHFLINCFYEENFRIKFSQSLMESLNFMAVKDNIQVINNLLNIVLNISSDYFGSEIVVKDLNFGKLSRFLVNEIDPENVDIELIPSIGLNILKKHKELEYHRVRL